MVVSSPGTKKPKFPNDIRWAPAVRKKPESWPPHGAIRALSWARPHANQPAMATHRILFVCLGNICRSPMAEGVFRRVAEEEGLIDRFEIDSAGLGDWHLGQAPDTRAQAAAHARGIDISGQSARQVTHEDFERFDLLLVMDRSNLAELKQLAPAEVHAKIRPFLDFAPDAGTKDVPDPFYGGAAGFDHALDLIEAAARGHQFCDTHRGRMRRRGPPRGGPGGNWGWERVPRAVEDCLAVGASVRRRSPASASASGVGNSGTA